MFLRASVFNFERLDILRDTIEYPSQKLLSFEFAHSFSFQLRAPRYITGFNQTSELKVIVVWIFLELMFSVSCVSIYNRTQSDFPVNSYCHLNFVRASVFYSERLYLLHDSIGHLTEKLLSIVFAQSFCFQLRVSRYITGLNRTSE